MIRIAVTGTAGQLVSSLLERAPAAGVEIVPLGRPLLDLSRTEGIAWAIEAVKPDAIVSSAAYTAVDKAESEEGLARVINGDAPGILAAVASSMAIPIVHVSTDYVFSGRKRGPYAEVDETGPTGAYGRSKLLGEKAVASATDNYAILRTAWVFSPFGNNFVKTMLRLAGQRDTLRVVSDQHGSPTSALDLADGVIGVTQLLIGDSAPDLRGIFHMVNAGETSWAGLAGATMKISEIAQGPHAAIVPITTAEYPTPATRPENSVLDCTKIQSAFGLGLRDWREALEPVVNRLVKEMRT